MSTANENDTQCTKVTIYVKYSADMDVLIKAVIPSFVLNARESNCSVKVLVKYCLDKLTNTFAQRQASDDTNKDDLRLWKDHQTRINLQLENSRIFRRLNH